MLLLLSPAKNLNFDDAPDAPAATKPVLSSHTTELAQTTQGLSAAKLKSLMKISDDLAKLNYERFQAFKTKGRLTGAKQAALAFNGDVYQGLDAASLSKDDFTFAQNHLRILSGLYGILRPLDAIQPYRLEMGSRLQNTRGKNLYEFWGDTIAKDINKTLRAQNSEFLINLASKEYYSAVDKSALDATVITPNFKDEKDGKLRSLQFYAKRARGSMARLVIQNKITDPAALKKLNVDGYRFQKSLSSETEWLFTRKQPPPKTAQKA